MWGREGAALHGAGLPEEVSLVRVRVAPSTRGSLPTCLFLCLPNSSVSFLPPALTISEWKRRANPDSRPSPARLQPAGRHGAKAGLPESGRQRVGGEEAPYVQVKHSGPLSSPRVSDEPERIGGPEVTR